MDYLRSCYTSYMRLYKDRPDVLTLGSWHWCQPGARPLPFTHIFGSRNWLPNYDNVDGLLGEVPGRVGYSKGSASTRLTGQTFCGGQELWQSGSLYSQRGTPATGLDGIPLCCLVRPSSPVIGLCDPFGELTVAGGGLASGGGLGNGNAVPPLAGDGGGAGGSAGYLGSFASAEGGGVGGERGLLGSFASAEGGGVGGESGIAVSVAQQTAEGGGVGGESGALLAATFAQADGGGLGDGDGQAGIAPFMAEGGGGGGESAPVPPVVDAEGGGAGGESGA